MNYFERTNKMYKVLSIMSKVSLSLGGLLIVIPMFYVEISYNSEYPKYIRWSFIVALIFCISSKVLKCVVEDAKEEMKGIDKRLDEIEEIYGKK
ncbi:hypothetical protein EDC18_1151 [Natranaerovirga pectinivora]|uniref:YiaAB two helix domain-containing protein n=1 Tax=Natranaerovirga pectinivora TaxID=682400 RepID=A0A4R3MH17_9FIRM|nr:hypothetical protein [Natranaerovirga pectinivora]TCT11657.1 hypothetical protein EDC18_1151 [Natranaerovirga pectinivora]